MKTAWIAAVLAALAAAAAGWWWFNRAPAPAPEAAVRAASAPVAASAPAPAASEAVAAPPVPAQPLTREQLPGALQALVGAKPATTFLQQDNFARRFVATVDNLGRAHAPSVAWPVHPTGGRFMVDEQAAGAQIAPDNAARYTPLVLLAESADAAKAVELYLRMYPLLQDEYRQLGFPGREFNQRLFEVIALLLATPEPQQPPQLQRLEVKGPVASERPWVRWEYADPALERLSSGQKILLRVGVVNERRLKKKLAEFRDELRRQSQAR